jgi:hypothetical protein
VLLDAAYWQQTPQRMAARSVVLFLQDNTELDFNGRHTAELAPLSMGTGRHVSASDLGGDARAVAAGRTGCVDVGQEAKDIQPITVDRIGQTHEWTPSRSARAAVGGTNTSPSQTSSDPNEPPQKLQASRSNVPGSCNSNNTIPPQGYGLHGFPILCGGD